MSRQHRSIFIIIIQNILRFTKNPFEFWYNEPDMISTFPQRFVALAGIFFIGLSATLTHAGEASDTITELQAGLVKIMKEGPTLGYEGRYRVITPIIDKTHDLPTIARIAIGRHWKNLTKEQQEEFVKTFEELSHSTYAARFDKYSGEQFSLISEKPLKRNRILVQSKFLKADGEEIRFNYVLHKKDGQWKIINIMVNGVSDLALKRTEYGGILKKDGYPTLIEKIRSQIQDNVNGNPGE